MPRVIAHFMRETEQASARNLMQVEAETESYIMGNVDPAGVNQLRNQGLIVNELPERPPGIVPALDALLGAARAQALGGADPTPEFAPPDLNQTQYFLIWLKGPLLEEWRSQLAEIDVELSESFPTGAYKVRLNPRQARLVSQLSFVAQVRVMSGLEAAPDRMTFGDAATPPVPTTGLQAVAFDILLHRPEDRNAVTKWLEDHSVSIAGASGRKIRAYFLENAPELNMLASLTEVQKVEEYVPPELHNDRARVLLNVEQPPNAVLTETGAGQVVAVADTGIDDTHPDFGNRIIGRVGLGRAGVTDDPHGHGTHVSGSIAGDGAASGGAFRGMAPGAKLYFQSLLDAKGKLGGLPIDLAQLFEDAFQKGARIHNNSWGAATSSRYTINASEVDDFVARRRDMLVVISAGNDGKSAPPLNNSAIGHVDWLSIGSPASCKNALTVGASRSDRQAGGLSTLTYSQAWPEKFPHPPIASDLVSGDPESLAGFSSRGPIDDRRIKPDVVAPGTDIASTKSSLAPFANFSGSVPNTSHYAFMGGTSMAAPLVSGCAALVREYLATAHNYDQPSAALMKAMLINGCRWLTGWDSTAPAAGMPNFHQGFGRINMADTLPNPAWPNLIVQYVDDWQQPGGQFTRTGERRRFRLRITGPCPSLRVCLAYTDLPARALQNNLDLFVLPPNGQKIVGNAQLANRLILPDPDNNVEVVRIDSPDLGDYLIQVSVTNLLRGPQDFALVVTGENLTDLQVMPP